MNKIEDQISLLRQEIEDYPLDDSNLQLYKKKFLNKEGKIQQLFHALPTLASNERKTVGIKLNQLKNLVQNRYEKIKVTVQDKTQKEEKDITLPPPTIGVGTLHILTQVRERIVAILKKIGFNVVEGPEIEDEWHNFSALNFPDHHPARDMQDTFFVTNPQGEKMYLRTQTSCVQIRVMEEKKLPIRILSIGRVFRKETISSRSHCVFHQVEGLYINTNVSFIDLKEVLIYFVQELFGKDIKMRLRPSFFPFTEPSAEIDIVCLLCKGAKCTVCKKIWMGRDWWNWHGASQCIA